MLTILLGPDDFSKKQDISSMAAQVKAQVEFFVDPENPPNLGDLLGQDLFAKKQVLVVEGLLPKYDFDAAMLDRLAASNNIIVFLETKIDKRLNSSKLLLSHKSVTVKQFDLPHGPELNDWISERVKQRGGKISKAAAMLLAKKLGRDEGVETKFGGKVTDVKEIFDLWQADGEVQKLLAYGPGAEINETDVENLVGQRGEVDVFKIINAIGERDKKQSLDLVGRFLNDGDNKTQIIQLNALLSDQFRNIFALQDFLTRKTPDDEILEQTGWKSGRLFVLKKIAGRFVPAKVKETLVKLAALDEELKTSSTPPRVLLDLILSQLFI